MGFGLDQSREVGPVDTTPSAKPAPILATRPPSAVVTAWPRSAQLTCAFLLGVSCTLLAMHGCSYGRWGSRPAEIERASPLTYRIDLNRADRAELLQLPGVGDSLASRIEGYRREHGDFRHVDDLIEVHGIGPATLDKLRPWVQAGEETGSEPSSEASVTKSSPRKKAAGTKQASLTEPIDINQASQAELQRLPGVGPKMSQRILDERLKAPFKSVDDLRRVSGIGPKTLEKLRPHVTVSSLRSSLVSREQR